MPTISPVLRITIGLLLLTVSLLLIGDVLGIVPNQKQSEIDARKIMAESFAIQVSSEIGENRLEKAGELLNIIVTRNQQVQSMGLRANSKQLVMKSDKHEKYWVNIEEDRSTATHIQVPIYRDQSRWGTLEMSFVPLNSIMNNLFTSRSFAAMVLFIVVFGFITYWLFLRRVLSELDPRSVVPDRVRTALDILTEGMVILDTNERIILANSSFKKKLGFAESELLGKQLSSLPWDMESDTMSLGKEKFPWNILLETNELPALKHLKLKTANDVIIAVDINVAPIKVSQNKIKGVIVTIDDVTELEKKNNELGRILKSLEKSKDEISRQNLELTALATFDSLSQLLNRRSLFDGLNNLLVETHNTNDVLSCIMLDIDFFKSVNDTLGHAAGDIVIKTIAEMIKEISRPQDLVGRYGGEEFVVVLPSTEETEAVQIAEKMRLTISQRQFDELAENFSVTASFGVTSTRGNTWVSDKLIDEADQGLYVAKKTGRNKVVRYLQKDIDHSKIQVQSKIVSKEHKNDIEKEMSIEPHTLNRVEHTEKPEASSQETLDMTEVPSRTVILDRLTQAHKLASRNKTNLAVLTIFIDTIQLTNNTLGHASAEKLKKIAFERLTGTFRLSDSVIPEVNTTKSISLSRSADSEFTAILTGIEEETDTTWAILRMFKDLSMPADIDGNEIVMTANIGVSMYPADGEHPEELLTNSKLALSEASEQGRGEFLFYNQKMNSIARTTLKMESQLHQAMEREEFYLSFQPIVNMTTGKVEKFEALMRWNNPELGSVPPDTFIKIAEHSGAIHSIGSWVLQKSCHQLLYWSRNGYPDLSISINLSAIQFHQRNLAEDIIAIVKEEGISPQRIIFELTETSLFQKNDDVLNIISKLHSEGFKIALDDFGTGYSSLEYLQNFPIDLIKIDRSLMINFPNEIHSVSIVSGLISLCHNLGMGVITEGVDDESQLSILRDLMCDEVQGYLISQPLSAEDTIQFLESTYSRRMIRKINATQNKDKHTQNNTSLSDILNSL